MEKEISFKDVYEKLIENDKSIQLLSRKVKSLEDTFNDSKLKRKDQLELIIKTANDKQVLLVDDVRSILKCCKTKALELMKLAIKTDTSLDFIKGGPSRPSKLIVVKDNKVEEAIKQTIKEFQRKRPSATISVSHIAVANNLTKQQTIEVYSRLTAAGAFKGIYHKNLYQRRIMKM